MRCALLFCQVLALALPSAVTVSRRCLAEPMRAIQRDMRVTAELAECLAAWTLSGTRCSRTTSLQAASAKSFPARSSAVITPASTASGTVCAFTLRTERLLPKPPQASISRQTSRPKSAVFPLPSYSPLPPHSCENEQLRTKNL